MHFIAFIAGQRTHVELGPKLELRPLILAEIFDDKINFRLRNILNEFICGFNLFQKQSQLVN